MSNIVSIHEGYIGHKNQGNWGTKVVVAGWNRPIDTTESMHKLVARVNGDVDLVDLPETNDDKEDVWYIEEVDFDWDVYKVAIHASVVTGYSVAKSDGICNPDDDIPRFGPGTCAGSDSIDDLYMNSNQVHSLVDQGYIRRDRVMSIFKKEKTNAY